MALGTLALYQLAAVASQVAQFADRSGGKKLECSNPCTEPGYFGARVGSGCFENLVDSWNIACGQRRRFRYKGIVP